MLKSNDMLKKTFLIYLMIIFISFAAGCGGGGGGGGTSGGPFPVSQSLEIEGSLPASLGLSPSAETAPKVFALSDKYVIGVSDKDTGSEIGTAVITASSYKAVIQITGENRGLVIILKLKDSGRPVFRNFIGRVPKASDVPPQVKTIRISQVPLDENSTARSLMAVEKKVSMPLIAAFSASETPGEIVVKEYRELSSALESPVEEASGGLVNISEMARAVKTVSRIIVSPNISEAVKTEIAPPQSDYSTASSVLKIFVSVLNKNETQNEINSADLPRTIVLSGKTIAASTKDDEIAPAVTAIKPLERLLPPVFTPAAGTYDKTVEIIISSNVSGTAVFYTEDGSVPGPSSKIFSSKIVSASDITLKAVAAREGYITSEVAVAPYKISLNGVTATPTLSLKSGSYFGTQEIFMACVTPGSLIFYTEDGSFPTRNSKQYTGKIILSSSKTIKVLAVKTGLLDSSMVTADYLVAGVLVRPVFNPAPGIFYETVEVKLSSETIGSEIYYTLGTEPVRLAKKYSAPFLVGSPLTINAFAVKAGMGTSEVVTGVYNIKTPDPIPPVEGMFFDINTKSLKWLPVTANNKKYVYLLKLNSELVITPALKPFYDASALPPGNYILMVSALTETMLADGEPGGPYSEPYSFKIPTAVTVPSVNNVGYNQAGFLSWEPKIDKLGKAYDYRIMFDNDISKYYISRIASFGIPDFLEPGEHTARIQAVVLDASDPFEFKIVDEGNWCSDFLFSVVSGDKVYKNIAVPLNMKFDRLSKTMKWDVSNSGGTFKYDIAATYSSGSSYYFNKFLGLDLAEKMVTLAEVNAKLPGDASGCVLEAVATDGFDTGLKSNALALPIVIDGDIPEVEGLEYDPNIKVVRWSRVGGSGQSYTYDLMLDGDLVSEGILTNEYSVDAITQLTHEVSVRAVLKNSVPPLAGPYSKSLAFSTRVGSVELVEVAKVTGLSYGKENLVLKWVPVTVNGTGCEYIVKIDGKALTTRSTGNVFSTNLLTPDTHEAQIRAVVLQNSQIVNQGPYSDPFVFKVVPAAPVKSRLEQVSIKNFLYDKDSNIVKWFPLDARKMKGIIAYYVVELDGKLEDPIDCTTYGLPASISIGQHTIRVKGIIPNTQPTVEGEFSEFFNFNVVSSRPAYKDVKKIENFGFNNDGQTMKWDEVKIYNQQVKYYVIVYIDTGAGLTEQSFPTFNNAGYLGVLRLDPRFQSLPSGLYTFEIQANIANTNIKGLKSRPLILNLKDKDRYWELPVVDPTVFN